MRRELIAKLVAICDASNDHGYAFQLPEKQAIAEARAALAVPVVTPDELDSQDFYELMQAYRHSADGMQTTVKAFEAVKDYLRARPAVPEGLALVPIEPTDEMCEAAWESEGTDYVGEHLRIWQIAPAYRAMIAVTQLKEPT